MKMLKIFTLISAGGLMYGLLEIAWRGDTHISMFLVGGLCFYLIGSIDERQDPPCVLFQALLSSLIVTSVEFTSGVIINMVLGLNVWDYSAMPYNILGQICLPFSVIWFVVSIPAIYCDDLLRTFIFGEEWKRERFLPSLKRNAEGTVG